MTSFPADRIEATGTKPWLPFARLRATGIHHLVFPPLFSRPTHAFLSIAAQRIHSIDPSSSSLPKMVTPPPPPHCRLIHVSPDPLMTRGPLIYLRQHTNHSLAGNPLKASWTHREEFRTVPGYRTRKMLELRPTFTVRHQALRRLVSLTPCRIVIQRGFRGKT